METSSSSHPHQNLATLQDKTAEKIAKAKSMITCIMFSTECIRHKSKVDNSTLYHALWAVDEYLESIEQLFQQLLSAPAHPR